MKSLTLKIGISLVALFGLGVASGFVIGHRVTMKQVRHAMASPTSPAVVNAMERAAKRWRDDRLAEYKRVLNLTPEQVVTVEKHFDKLTEDFKTLKSDTRARIVTSVTDLNRAIAQDLTPDQRRLFWDHLREKSRRTAD